MSKLPEIYQDVKSVFNPSALSRGSFDPDEPLGVTISTTGERNLARVMAQAASKREGYHLIIDRDGAVHQTAYLSQRVSHAGRAYWFGSSPNKTHLAVGLVSWGRVFPATNNLWQSTTGAKVRTADVSLRPSNVESGNFHWDACTIAQEKSLQDLLAWLGAHGISPDLVCGLDECAQPIGREMAPGGSLSISMVELREKLRAMVMASAGRR